MLTTWSPWQEISRLEHAMNHLLDNGRVKRAESTVPTWAPPVDVFEDGSRITLVADLPGVEEKDLELSVDKNVLTVKGTRANPEVAEAGNRRLERAQGSFSRAFSLPTTVDAERIEAHLKAGVLTLTLHKKAEAQPRQIKIAVS